MKDLSGPLVFVKNAFFFLIGKSLFLDTESLMPAYDVIDLYFQDALNCQLQNPLYNEAYK